ncbi:MAG: methionyl-tRNA formyltransferase [Bacteroidetes bacterium]|nr:MAG: methionyl-tRNA formyltransferase [Bacteroidota bacterium]
MGTPEFAVPSLDILVRAGHEVVAVVTAPDQPSGRGLQLRPSAVKVYAEAQGLQVLQPEKLRNPAFVARLRELQADLAVVVAFRMLPEAVWSLPRLGTFNLHASLLPDYRGAAPINRAIMNGETRSGATTFLIDKEIDTGNILLQQSIDIPPHWNAGDLHDALMDMGATLVRDTVEALGKGNLKAHPQDPAAAQHPAPKIFKEDCQLDWTQPALQVHNQVRGLSPYPAAWTLLEGKILKIFRSQIIEKEANTPGAALATPDHRLLICCSDAWLEILELQAEGKKRMPAADFLRGYKGGLKIG